MSRDTSISTIRRETPARRGHSSVTSLCSTTAAAADTTALRHRAREAVLRFFNASADEWSVVFTANASEALKLVGESYPFDAAGEYLLTFDNHNSVNGIREFARARGA